MREISLIILALIININSFSQNTFPSTGNVGIGTATPAAALSFTDVDATTSSTGITWYSASGGAYATQYGIHRTSGTWSHPNYQQLRLGWETGIVLDPGTAYGKSYVDIMGNGLRVTNGNVGIGTAAPSANVKLHVANGDLVLQNTTSGYPILWLKDITGNKRIRIDYNSLIVEGDNLYLQSSGGNVFMNNGKVGIGTTSVSDVNYKLFVETGIRTRKVKVDVAAWSDYVFYPGYKLPTLKEIEDFIKTYKHLPDVPSAQEVEKEGIDLGQTQALLLKKIEELTLYIIEQGKKQEMQQMEINQLKKQIQLLTK